MSSFEKALLCAANNCDLYQSVFRAHGLPSNRERVFWSSEATPPPYYSNFLVLDPAQQDIALAELDRLSAVLPGVFSLKDGFAGLDLVSRGFHILFEAQWIWADAAQALHPPANDWRRIAREIDLAEWERAWAENGSPTSQRVFPAAILSDRDVALLGCYEGKILKAGCMANRSSHVVGLSNIFMAGDEAVDYSVFATAAASAFDACLPVVGYERGDRLETAIEAGFEKVGALRVWLRGQSPSR